MVFLLSNQSSKFKIFYLYLVLVNKIIFHITNKKKNNKENVQLNNKNISPKKI